MATLLYIEASPRKQRSHSIKVADAFLDAYRSANPGDKVDTLDLWSTELPAFNGDMINAKYAVMHSAELSSVEQTAWGKVEQICRRFTEADKYLFSVPMWNFGIPYILKHYIDVITQPGFSWSFDPDAGYSGLVTGPVAAIYSSGGTYHEGSGAEAFDQQKPYFEGWLGFIGLSEVSSVTVAPTLEAPDNVAVSVNTAIEEAKNLAATF
ncbi:MAG: NAD(P)H-dependent oxidoreductase [Gammaproteobacteria bacterium]